MRINRSGVYQIVNEINGKSYIGSSKDIINRWKQWRNFFKKETTRSVSLLRLAVRKYGIEHFTFIILEECDATKKSLVALEQHYIDTIKPDYNIFQTAYSSLGYKHLPENIQKMKQTLATGRNGGTVAMKNGTHIFLTGFSKEIVAKKAAKMKANGTYERLLKTMRILALSDSAMSKRKATFDSIQHQQGERNSQFGTCWVTNDRENKKIKAEELPNYLLLGFRKGRNMSVYK